MNKQFIIFLIIANMLASCTNSNEKTADNEDSQPGTFGYDLNFLQKHDSVIILKNGDAQIVVSPKYQAKVFTSTADGLGGTSFGWINYKAFDATPDPHINAYGGENRIWLGPEGGAFSLFFPKGAKMEFANWRTPAAFDTEPWLLTEHSDSAATLQKDMQLVNYAGTTLQLSVQRKISLLDKSKISQFLQIRDDSSVHSVGYITENILMNTGQMAWDQTTGMPCIWVLDMFKPSGSAAIVIPYNGNAQPKPATTDYFGEIPNERIKYENNILFYKADGKMRGKLGIHPSAAKNVAGSYDPEKKVLTIVLFDIESSGKYMNQEWRTDRLPFSGDAVNAYNDGPLASGGQLGPFYEVESVSPAAFLKPGGMLIHHHSVFHFTGDEKALSKISEKVLGASIDQIKKTFQ